MKQLEPTPLSIALAVLADRIQTFGSAPDQAFGRRQVDEAIDRLVAARALKLCAADGETFWYLRVGPIRHKHHQDRDKLGESLRRAVSETIMAERGHYPTIFASRWGNLLTAAERERHEQERAQLGLESAGGTVPLDAGGAASPGDVVRGAGAPAPVHDRGGCEPVQSADPAPAAQPAGSDHVEDERGLFQKFVVLRKDGSSAPGAKHGDCQYFVLDLNHDKHARAAIAAYVEDCRDEHPQLAADLTDRYLKPRPGLTEVVGDRLRNPSDPLGVEDPSIESGGLEVSLERWGRSAIGRCAEEVRQSALELGRRMVEAIRRHELAWKPTGGDYDRSIHQSMDAKRWADLFVQTMPALARYHDVMLGWFANAIMAAIDWEKAQEEKRRREADPESGWLIEWTGSSATRGGSPLWLGSCDRDVRWGTAIEAIRFARKEDAAAAIKVMLSPQEQRYAEPIEHCFPEVTRTEIRTSPWPELAGVKITKAGQRAEATESDPTIKANKPAAVSTARPATPGELRRMLDTAGAEINALSSQVSNLLDTLWPICDATGTIRDVVLAKQIPAYVEGLRKRARLADERAENAERERAELADENEQVMAAAKLAHDQLRSAMKPLCRPYPDEGESVTAEGHAEADPRTSFGPRHLLGQFVEAVASEVDERLRQHLREAAETMRQAAQSIAESVDWLQRMHDEAMMARQEDRRDGS